VAKWLQCTSNLRSNFSDNVVPVYLLTGLNAGLQLTDSAPNLSNTAVTIVASAYLLTGLNAGLQLTDSALKLEERHCSDNIGFIFTFLAA
jgi:hypothetical protein